MTRTLISGACDGADMYFDKVAREHGFTDKNIIHYTPNDYKALTPQGVALVEKHYKTVCESLKRPILPSDSYGGALTRRNMMIALKAPEIYAIGAVVFPGEKDYQGYKNTCKFPIVAGGTAYAVELGRLLKKTVFVFDQYENDGWEGFQWDHTLVGQTLWLDHAPAPSGAFAGIGTRNLNENGKRAISDLFNRLDQK